jgi:hypothetical protein
MTTGLTDAWGLPVPPVDEDVGVSVGVVVGQVSGRHEGGPCVFVGEDDGGAEVVGSLVVALDVGADDDVVCRVVGGGADQVAVG